MMSTCILFVGHKICTQQNHNYFVGAKNIENHAVCLCAVIDALRQSEKGKWK